MTRLPWESWNVEALGPSGPPQYELSGECAHPDCRKVKTLEDHHIWRRSFGKNFREAWWVRLEDGRIVPNRVHLCEDHHRQVTTNVARIVLVDTEGGLVFYWDKETIVPEPLDPQPGPLPVDAGGAPVGNQDPFGGARQLTVEGEEVLHSKVVEHRDDETEPCSRCKGKGRVPRREKREKSSRDRARPQVIAIRIPRSEDGGYETLTTLHDAAETILVELGILRERGRGAGYYRDVAVYQGFVQENRELLPDSWKQEDADEASPTQEDA